MVVEFCSLFLIFNLNINTLFLHILKQYCFTIGFKTLEVVAGHQDVYVHTTLIKKWDICAGNAILNHFGGKMTTLSGNNIDYSSEIDYKNPGGLIASLNNHEYFKEKLKDL